MPWTRLLEIALGMLGWSEPEFMESTLRGLVAAIRGKNESTSGQSAPDPERLVEAAEAMPERVESMAPMKDYFVEDDDLDGDEEN